jgi:hypothetical protein
MIPIDLITIPNPNIAISTNYASKYSTSLASKAHISPQKPRYFKTLLAILNLISLFAGNDNKENDIFRPFYRFA